MAFGVEVAVAPYITAITAKVPNITCHGFRKKKMNAVAKKKNGGILRLVIRSSFRISPGKSCALHLDKCRCMVSR